MNKIPNSEHNLCPQKRHADNDGLKVAVLPRSQHSRHSLSHKASTLESRDLREKSVVLCVYKAPKNHKRGSKIGNKEIKQVAHSQTVALPNKTFYLHKREISCRWFISSADLPGLQVHTWTGSVDMGMSPGELRIRISFLLLLWVLLWILGDELRLSGAQPCLLLPLRVARPVVHQAERKEEALSRMQRVQTGS